MRWVTRTVLIAAAAWIVAAPPSQAQEKDEPKKGDRNTIVPAEFQSREDLRTAWDIARMLRPRWFRTTGRAASTAWDRSDAPTSGSPVVYIDNTRQNSIEVLKSIRSAEIIEIKYMEPQKAMALYDDDHWAGAIFVTTTRPS